MLERGRRSTRGQRMTELVGEALEMDKAFWEHSVWAEAEDDSGNESFDENEEEVKPDVFDSDFNDTETEESDEDEEGQLKRDQRRQRAKAVKSSGAYKEPAKRAPAPTNESSAPKPKPKDTGPQELAVTLRQSTKSKSDARAKEEEAKAKSAIKVHRTPIPKKEYCQRDLLMEALDTEIQNFKWLKSQQLAEEERNRLESKAPKAKKKISRTFLSNQNSTTITFADDQSWPSIFSNDDIDYLTNGATTRKKRHDETSNVCVVTGQPARYRDPKTWLPYRDLAAFRILRSSQSAGVEINSDSNGAPWKKHCS